MRKVSTVIVSFNTRELLDRSITSVFAGSPNIDKEVIIIENASVDGSREMLAEKYPGVKVIYNDDNRGYAPACNQGLREASGEFVFALNSDAFVVGDALSEMVGFMDAFPEVCAIGPRLLNSDGSVQHGCARRTPTFCSQLTSLTPWLSWIPALRRYYELRMPLDFYEKTNDVDIISGAALFLRNDALTTVGYLDDSLIVNGDDVEWCLRARRMGCRLVYFPRAEVIHIGRASRGFDSSSMYASNVESLFNLYGRMHRWPKPGILKLAMVCNISVTLIRNAVVAPFSSYRRKKTSALARLLGTAVRLALRRSAS